MSAYSITRDDVGKDYAAASHALNIITNFGGVSPDTRERLESLVASIKEQLIPAEPAGGKTVVFVNEMFWSWSDDGRWVAWDVPDTEVESWSDLVRLARSKDRRDPVQFVERPNDFDAADTVPLRLVVACVEFMEGMASTSRRHGEPETWTAAANHLRQLIPADGAK